MEAIMSDTVWVYWEGPQPPYISLCLQTMATHCPKLTVLDRAGFDALFRDNRDLRIDDLAVNHRSDFVRAYLLSHYGGLYLDADCIVLRDLAPVLMLASAHGLVAYREPQGYLSCNFLACEPNSPLILHHYRYVCERIRAGGEIAWLDLATVPMERAVRVTGASFCELPTDLVMPLAWNESELLTIRRSDWVHTDHLVDEAYCYMLSNNTIASREQTRMLLYLPETELISQTYFLSFLFRRALGLAPVDQVETAEHLGGHENKTLMDEAALDYLVDHFGVGSMVDIGCGPGGMLFYAQSRGIRAVGIDGDPDVARHSRQIIEHDYATGPLSVGEFDLGWAVEFVEHVDEEYVPNFMATLRGCKHVFMTAAVPGQPGHHHVNCRDGSYWIERFAAEGFRLDDDATRNVRERSRMASLFASQTGMVFSRT
jgi:hypothetical protein